MTWIVNAVGKPENVISYLKAQTESFSGNSLAEYKDALPHLIGLVEQNFRKDAPADMVGMIKLEASGTGLVEKHNDYPGPPLPIRRTCSVRIEPFNNNLV
jgi:hypothetical protein